MKVLDLTQPLDEQTAAVAGLRPVRADAQPEYDVDGFWWRDLSFAEHSGTHIDAPSHTVPGGAMVADIPAELLVRPAVRIDARALCGGDPSWVLRAEDLEAWEAEHGRVPAGCAVLLCTGWDAFRRRPGALSRRPAGLPGLRPRCRRAARRAAGHRTGHRHAQRRRGGGGGLPRAPHHAPAPASGTSRASSGSTPCPTSAPRWSSARSSSRARRARRRGCSRCCPSPWSRAAAASPRPARRRRRRARSRRRPRP